MKNRQKNHHIVRKAVFEVEFPDAADKADFQKQLSTLFRTVLLPNIEKASDSQSPPGRHHAIEQLVIDLGTVPLHRFSETAGRKFATLFEENLKDRILAEGSRESVAPSFGTVAGATQRAEAPGKLPGKDVSKAPPSSPADRDNAVVRHFLETGLLPWWVQAEPDDALNRAFRQLADSPVGKSRMATYLNDPHTLKRLISEADDELLRELLEIVDPKATRAGGTIPVARAARFQYWQKAFGLTLGSTPGNEATTTALTDPEITPDHPLDRTFRQLIDSPAGKTQIINFLQKPYIVNPLIDEADDELLRELLEIVAPQAKSAEGTVPVARAARFQYWQKAFKLAFGSTPTKEEKSKGAEPEDDVSENTDRRKSDKENEPTRPGDEITNEPGKRVLPGGDFPAETGLGRGTATAGPDKTSQKKVPHTRPALLADMEAVYLNNAGLVILWPFLEQFFSVHGLTDKQNFVSAEAQHRAALLLQGLATGMPRAPEYHLPLNKVLCGIPLTAPLEPTDDLPEAELASCTGLLEAVTAQVPVLKGTSADGFRRNFLLREGVMKVHDDHWKLNVQHRAYDILLQKLPWPYHFVKLPWMNHMLYVEWLV